MSKKQKDVRVGDAPVTPIGGARKRNKIKKAIKKRYDRYRKKYPEVHGKVVDFITQSIEDGTLYSESVLRTRQTFRSGMPAICLLSERTFAT